MNCKHYAADLSLRRPMDPRCRESCPCDKHTHRVCPRCLHSEIIDPEAVA